jgi:8-oxo-dGTP diphosphatase
MRAIDVVCALIERDGRVLVARRPEGKALAGKWEFPGGKVESGEAPETALLREIREELGCEVRAVAALPARPHAYPEATIRLLPFRCRLAAGTPEAREHSALAWVAPAALATLDLAAADLPVLADYLAFLSARPRISD